MKLTILESLISVKASITSVWVWTLSMDGYRILGDTPFYDLAKGDDNNYYLVESDNQSVRLRANMKENGRGNGKIYHSITLNGKVLEKVDFPEKSKLNIERVEDYKGKKTYKITLLKKGEYTHSERWKTYSEKRNQKLMTKDC